MSIAKVVCNRKKYYTNIIHTIHINVVMYLLWLIERPIVLLIQRHIVLNPRHIALHPRHIALHPRHIALHSRHIALHPRHHQVTDLSDRGRVVYNLDHNINDANHRFYIRNRIAIRTNCHTTNVHAVEVDWRWGAWP